MNYERLLYNELKTIIYNYKNMLYYIKLSLILIFFNTFCEQLMGED